MAVLYAQGDLLIERIDDVPVSGEVLEPAADGATVLLDGKTTGHRHAIYDRVTMFRVDALAQDIPGSLYVGHVHVEGPVALVKHEEHDPVTLPRGTYRVRRQRELRAKGSASHCRLSLKAFLPCSWRRPGGIGSGGQRLGRPPPPANRVLAERGVVAAYEAAGRPAPKRIIWCSSPLEMASSWAATSAQRAGPNLRPAIVDKVRTGVALAIQRRVHGKVLAKVDELLRNLNGSRESVREVVIECCNLSQPSVLRRKRWPFWSPEFCPGINFEDTAFCPRFLGWLVRHDFFRTVCGFGECTPLEGLLLLAGHADWIIPHKYLCWVCERPKVFVTDAIGRLHNSHGPALQYAGEGEAVDGPRLERREGPAVGDRRAARDIEPPCGWGIQYPCAPLYDRSDDARALHRKRRCLSRFGGRNRRALGAALGGWGCLGCDRGHKRDA